MNHNVHGIDLKEITSCPYAPKAVVEYFKEEVLNTDDSTLSKLKQDFLAVVTGPDFMRLDAYVVKLGVKIESVNDLVEHFKKLMYYLNDNLGSDNELEVPNWRFIFNNTSFFVIVMSDIYTRDSTRWYPDGHVILFQPEHSFHRQIPRSKRKAVITSIRKIFAKQGADYGEIVEDALEPQKYIFPLTKNDELINWWL